MVKYKTVIPGFLSFTEPIPSFSNYNIDKDGNIYNRSSGKILKPDKSGRYLRIELWKNKKRFRKRIHRLVLEAFRGKCPDGMEACHNNGNKLDNKLTNLRWDNHKNNCGDRKIYKNKVLVKFLSPYTSCSYRDY